MEKKNKILVVGSGMIEQEIHKRIHEIDSSIEIVPLKDLKLDQELLTEKIQVPVESPILAPYTQIVKRRCKRNHEYRKEEHTKSGSGLVSVTWICIHCDKVL